LENKAKIMNLNKSIKDLKERNDKLINQLQLAEGREWSAKNKLKKYKDVITRAINELEGMREVLLTESTSSKDERTRKDISFIYENEYQNAIILLKKIIEEV